MSLSLAIAVIVLADLAIIGVLAFAMHLPSRLTPHASASTSASEHRRPHIASSTVRSTKRRASSAARTFAARS